MENASSRLMAAVGCLAIFSIAVFWLYEPGGRSASSLAPLPEIESPLPAARTGRERVNPAPAPSDQLPTTHRTDTVKPQPEPGTAGQPQGTKTSGTNTQGSNNPSTGQSNQNTQPVRGVIPPSFVDYTVKANETFESIAKARYGSPKFHTAIARSNPLKDPRRLRAGDVIRLPVDPTNIQGKPVEVKPDATSGGPTANPIPAGNFTEYTVEPGDTLSGIARTVWGSSKNWRKILDANQAVLPSEDKLKPGMKLRIPPKPAD